jgi:hypothetical protein
MSGAEFFGNGGILQLHTLSPALSYVTKGLATTTSGLTISARSSFFVDVPKSSVTTGIVGTRSVGGVAPLYTADNGSSIRHWFNTDMAVGSNVAYYVFDVSPQQVGGANFGMELYSPAGVRLFSAVENAPVISHILSSGAVNLTSGRSYAVCVTSFAGYRTQTTFGEETTTPYIQQTGMQYGGGITLSPYQARVVEVDFLSGQSEAAPNFSIPLPAMMVIDVTEYGSIAGEQSFYLTMTPGGETTHQVNQTSRVFSAQTINMVGSGTISSYSWSFPATNGIGTWSIASGQGTATATPQVTGVGLTQQATATLRCSVVVNGATQILDTNFAYTNAGANENVTVTISPSVQGGGEYSASYVFSPATANVSGGTPVSYSWYYSAATGGTWSFTGSGASVTPSVNSVPQTVTASATLTCSVTTTSGMSYTASCSLSYSHYSQGGGGTPEN